MTVTIGIRLVQAISFESSQHDLPREREREKVCV